MDKKAINTETDELLASLDDSVLTLTLNRPDALNALSRPMITALKQQLVEAEFDVKVKCIVITGAGRGFCAGGDVRGMTTSTGELANKETLDEAIHRQRDNQRETAGRLFKMPKPTIASIPGPAAGAGLSLALACDLRIMARSSFLTTAFAHVGFSGDYGGTYFMTQLIGSAKARELYFLSERLNSEEALGLGLVNWLCDSGELAVRTRALALRLAQGPTVAYRYMKENLNRAMGGEVDECLDLEATHHIHCARTEDHREAARAFLEKRKPTFNGR